MTERPPQAAIARLEKAVERSQRKSGARVPTAFVRDEQSEIAAPPLARLLRGGGGVRIRVFLTVTMMATKPPHDTTVSSRDLAEMLNLPDPGAAGARRVTKAFNDLAALRLVERQRRPGHTPSTMVLDPSGSGEAWNDRQLSAGYVGLPSDFWRRGWVIALSGRAIALLLILREATRGRANNRAWLDGIRKQQYGLSDDTWTKAIDELEGAGLLDVEVQVHKSHGEPRRRNVYTLHFERLSQFDPGGVPGDREEADD